MSVEEKSIVKEELTALINSKYSNHTMFFVDGSKDPDSGRAGAGISGGTREVPINLKHRLSDGISSTQAELAAINILCFILSEIIHHQPNLSFSVTHSQPYWH